MFYPDDIHTLIDYDILLIFEVYGFHFIIRITAYHRYYNQVKEVTGDVGNDSLNYKRKYVNPNLVLSHL